MPTSDPLLQVDLGDASFVRLDLDHPEIEPGIVEEITSGIDVYYDREWPFTRRFCRYLLEHPTLVQDRDVLVVGAGVGLESVVAGTLCRQLWVNDWAPEALRLLRRQLRANGLTRTRAVPGSFAEIELPPVDLVLACFVVYDRESRAATLALERRVAAADIPLLLGGEDIGGHLTALLDRVERPVRILTEDGDERIVLVGPALTELHGSYP